MKTMICCFAIISMILVGAPVYAENWILYDDFKSGIIDLQLWGGLEIQPQFALH